MEAQRYRLLVDQALARVAAKLADEDPDEVDCAGGDGMLTIEFGDGAKFVVSRQSATQQIWVAAGSRAWHYSRDDARGAWLDDKDGHEMLGRLSEVVSNKIGRPVTF